MNLRTLHESNGEFDAFIPDFTSPAVTAPVSYPESTASRPDVTPSQPAGEIQHPCQRGL